MSKVLACMLLAVMVVSGVELYEEQSFFTRLAQKEYGRTIIQTIQLELGQDNAVNSIVRLLRQLLDDLNAENQRASSALQSRQQYCSEKVAEVDQYVERVQRNRADYERALPLRQEELGDKRRQLQQKQEELARNKARLDNFHNQRQKEHQEYEQRRDELVAMVNGLKQAQNIVRQLQSNSFVERRHAILAELGEHTTNLFSQVQRKTGFRGLITSLMELCSDSQIHADQNSVQVILDIIDELVESIYEVQKDEMFADDQKQKYFQQDLSRIQIENNRLQAINNQDNAVVELLQSRLTELQQQIGVSQMVLESKKVERNEFVSSCSEEVESSRQLADQRNEQIEVINQLIELFDKNFSDRVRAMFLELNV